MGLNNLRRTIPLDPDGNKKWDSYLSQSLVNLEILVGEDGKRDVVVFLKDLYL